MAEALIKDTPAFLHESYEAMEKRWNLVRMVYDGTEAMRENYKDLLWQSPAESPEEFQRRGGQAEMFPAFKQTVDGLVGVVFRVEPQLGEDVPATIQALAENIDGQGNHLVVFAKEVFREAMRDGHVGVLVDAPVAPDGGFRTRGQEQRAGLKPYWIKIAPDDILSFRVMIVNGLLVLKQIVFKEVSVIEDGLFTSGVEVLYRKYKLEDDGRVTFRVWTQDQVDEWTEDSYKTPTLEGVIANQTSIPFVAIYGGPRIAPLVSRPPLLDLAYTNIAHANVVSDRRNGLHAALHPILVTKGRRQRKKQDGSGEENDQLVGPNIGIDLPADPNADAKYVEHQGHALGAGRDETQDLEKRMAAMGLAMLQSDTRAAETAEAKRIDKDEKTANLSSAARSLQDGMELLLAYTANFLKESTGGSVIINRDFEIKPIEATMITALSNMVANGQFSLETLWDFMKRNGVLPEDFSSEDELARILMGGGQGQTLPATGSSTAAQDTSTTPPEGQ